MTTKKIPIVELGSKPKQISNPPRKYSPLILKPGLNYSAVNKNLVSAIAEIDQCIAELTRSK